MFTAMIILMGEMVITIENLPDKAACMSQVDKASQLDVFKVGFCVEQEEGVINE